MEPNCFIDHLSEAAEFGLWPTIGDTAQNQYMLYSGDGSEWTVCWRHGATHQLPNGLEIGKRQRFAKMIGPNLGVVSAKCY